MEVFNTGPDDRLGVEWLGPTIRKETHMSIGTQTITDMPKQVNVLGVLLQLLSYHDVLGC